jgi:hypothetical protein
MNFQHKLGKRKAEQAERNERIKQSTRTKESFFTILQISPIPESYTISQVLLLISPYVKDAIGIMRVADYKAKRLGEAVFIYFPFKQSAVYLETIKLEVDNKYVNVLIVPMKVGRASFIDKDFGTSFHGVPITVMLKSLERKQEAPIYYLLELSRYFEKKGVVTGLRLGYDEKRDYTVNHGYITFLRQADARQVSGEGAYIEHDIQRHKIRATLSENLPMLVNLEDAHFLENGIVPWNQEAEALNQLIITYEWPGYLQHHTKVDNKRLIKDLYDKYHKKYPNNDQSEASKKISKDRKITSHVTVDTTTDEEADEEITTNESKKPHQVGESSKQSEKQVDKATKEPTENQTEKQLDSVDSDEEVLQIDLGADIPE